MEQSIATSQIFNADCLEKMKDLDDDSVDLIFCDLPYGQTSCKWDCCIDLFNQPRKSVSFDMI